MAHRRGHTWVSTMAIAVAMWLVSLSPTYAELTDGQYLYVAVPGIRNYLEYGGHGLLVFDRQDGHKFVRRIPLQGFGPDGKPLNVKGICGSAATGLVYVSTLKHLQCVDLHTDQLKWQKEYAGGCDRMAITPDGTVIYLPTLEQDHWKVIAADDGRELTHIITDSGSHNTVMGPDGRYVYLAGLRSPLLPIVDTQTHQIVRRVGPFSNSIRPFTVNGTQTLCFVNVNELLGFEIGDLQSGKMLHRVEVAGFTRGEVKRHGCPSHGIGLTPDERELWLADAANSRLHIFDLSVMPPKQVASIEVREQPGWITFSRDGKFAYPSTGDVIDVATRTIVAQLTDESGGPVHSEKVLEVKVQGGKLQLVGDQFGVGRVMRAGD